jgi:hypothetical protein
MLEAFERHLTSIDISRKFEKANTNEEKIKVCKEFLEKQGFEVKFKPKFETEEEYFRNQLHGAMGTAPTTWVSNNTATFPPPIQSKDAKVLQAQQIVSDDMLRNFAYGDVPGHIKNKLLSQMMPDIMDHAAFMIEQQQQDFSVRAKLKLGVFKP